MSTYGPYPLSETDHRLIWTIAVTWMNRFPQIDIVTAFADATVMYFQVYGKLPEGIVSGAIQTAWRYDGFNQSSDLGNQQTEQRLLQLPGPLPLLHHSAQLLPLPRFEAAQEEILRKGRNRASQSPGPRAK